ncbi:hypothetical protein JNM87_00450 [Candidatus Saccharibacteria bacterium]|nr:hypothetical protein [Candidatus Saccharibacteria bacterium]
MRNGVSTKISSLKKLKVLVVTTTNMTAVPDEIGQMQSLQSLDLSYNNLNSLPASIKNLSDTLKELNISGNPMTRSEANYIKQMLPNTTVIAKDLVTSEGPR